MTDKSSDVLNELTSNVLSAIQKSTNGFEIEPLTGNFTIADVLESENALPIFQDFIIILDPAQDDIIETQLKTTNVTNDPSFGLDLSNATVIFNPNTFTIGDDNTKIDPAFRKNLTENIINAVQVIIIFTFLYPSIKSNILGQKLNVSNFQY